MKNLWRAFIAIGLLLVIIQGPSLGETKKIKKILKELKKLKKYGYLLAGQRKKLYAIPFPMPLPVFVKRQQIYTQVPIITRYVPHPQSHYGAPEISVPDSPPASYEPHDSHYGAAEASYPSEVEASYLPPKSYNSASQSSRKHKHSSSSQNNYQKQQPQQQQQQQDQQQQWIGAAGKLLSQFVNLLSQSGTMLGNGASKEIISMFASGQARVLPPSALLSAIKSPSAPALMGAHYDEDQNRDQAQSLYRGTKSSKSSSSGYPRSPSHNSVSYDDSAPSTATNSTKSPDSSSDIKASSSDMYRTALGFRPNYIRYAAYNPYTSPYRLNPMMAPFVSPLAAITMAGRLAGVQPGGNLLRSPLGANVLPLIDSLSAANQIDQQDDPQEASSSNQQEESPQTVRDFSRAYQNLLRQRQLQQLLQQQQRQSRAQSQADPIMVSASLNKLHRHQAALKMALLREQEVAARLAESRQILVRAHQLGLPMAPGSH